ncbi:MAG: DNA-processing protein DprA [Candidatus Roizmanbacteria bacterium]
MKDDLLYYLAFSHFLGIGPMRFAALKKHFGSAKKAYLADKKELLKVIGVSLTEKFIDFRNIFDPVKKLDELKKKGILVLPVDNDDYPESVKNISDPPICIYIKGSIPNFSPFLLFAIVGTRNPTSYGIQVTKKFAHELTKAGFIIISGMAYGIDTIAHQSCLEAGGKTIAVLGCGVDIVYPATNKNLYEKIIRSGGAVISEFPPGQFVLKGLFVARNRIISALSRGVMIVEGTKDSGSLITARYAAEQGKDVFAPPSPITSDMSVAPNLLLKQGAKLVTTVEDIYEEFNMKTTPKKKENILEKLNKEEREIFVLLNEKPILIDNLVLRLEKPINQVLNTLSVLEINGVIEKNNENYYQVRL